MLNFKLDEFPIKYMGLPVSEKTVTIADWDFLPENIGDRDDP